VKITRSELRKIIFEEVEWILDEDEIVRKPEDTDKDVDEQLTLQVRDKGTWQDFLEDKKR
tara:strand:+ start:1127 stop:1306 length:180 start_codon:yes stop_codon:yes gene_type:complete